MAFIKITLDTTAPTNPLLIINGGATFTNSQLVDLAISTDDADRTGYQMKIWGGVDPSHDANIGTLEENSQWIGYSTTKQIKLASTAGENPEQRTVYLLIRDDVHNVSSTVSDTITLDTALPQVNIGQPDVTRVSLQPNKNVASFTFSSTATFVEYKVKVVSSTGATHTTGVQLATTNGSENVLDTGTFNTPITVTVNANDLKTASDGDGEKIIKVFVKNQAGTWSV